MSDEQAKQTVEISERKVVVKKRSVVAETVRLLEIRVSPGMNKLKCNGCLKKVGEERPIAVVWAENRGIRLCRKCSIHLTETPKPNP